MTQKYAKNIYCCFEILTNQGPSLTLWSQGKSACNEKPYIRKKGFLHLKFLSPGKIFFHHFRHQKLHQIRNVNKVSSKKSTPLDDIRVYHSSFDITIYPLHSLDCHYFQHQKINDNKNEIEIT